MVFQRRKTTDLTSFPNIAPAKTTFRFLCLLLFFCTGILSAQTVSVDDSKSAEELVNILLNDACAEIDNSSVSSTQATGSFNNNGGAFPIEKGIIIRTGESRFSAGKYTNKNLSSQLNTDTDEFLQNLADESGQPSIVNDVAFLEFEFVPISESLSFDFLLASNEYGDFQCVSQDVLAFVLTDLTTNTSNNLALVPGSTAPISVRNIRDNTYNPTCDSQNADLFGSYEVDNPNSTINMRGYTQLLNASATIIPGRRYKIRIAIGDSNDSTYDSAIFLSAGSFNTGVNLGPDFSLCTGNTAVLDAGLDNPAYTYEWLRNGVVIAGQTSPTLTVDEEGTYKIKVNRTGSTCEIPDEVIVSGLNVTDPINLPACFNEDGQNTFDLTTNDGEALNADGFDLFYYASQADAINNNPIPEAQLKSYSSPGNQTIIIKFKNKVTEDFCDAQYPFELIVSDQIVVTKPVDIPVCTDGATAETVDLSNVAPKFNNGQDAANFSISFYESLANAESARDTIANLPSYTIPAGTSLQTIFLRVAYVDNPSCYVTTSFDIVLTAKPTVPTLPDAVACSSYTLPDLTKGAYFSDPNGTGTALNVGSTITKSGTVYVYLKDQVTGCDNESNFKVTILDDFTLTDLRECGSYEIPDIMGVQFYTESGGPDGSGNLLPAGMNLRGSQTIWLYAEINNVICKDVSYNIIVDTLPDADDPIDVITCDPYVLPQLTDGTYNSKSDGSGTVYTAGQTITESTDLYVYAKNDTTSCERNNFFPIFITPTVADFENTDEGLEVCGQYKLPKVAKGAFYTQPNGQGTPLAEDTLITTSQTLYYYVKTTVGANCTENLPLNIIVKPIPKIDEVNNIEICEGDTYLLEPLNNGKYYLKTGGIDPIAEGAAITSNDTIYIYNELNGCSAEGFFEIKFRSKPQVQKFPYVLSCNPYVLPDLKYEARYYSESGAKGQELKPGDTIKTSQIVYIYNNYPDLNSCSNESDFQIDILGVEVADVEDVAICDSYTLPALKVGNYFTEKRGRGTQLMSGTVLTETQKVYVYAQNLGRILCFDEKSFNITISTTPILPPQPDLDQCGSLTLPALDRSVFNVEYYRGPGATDKIEQADYNFTEAGTYTIYRYATATNNDACIAEDSFTIIVYPRPEFSVPGGTICVNAETDAVEDPFLLESGLDPARFTVFWELNDEIVHIGESHIATKVGTYTVRTEKVDPEVGADCNYKPTTVEVLASSKPAVQADVTQPFSDMARITITVKGPGEYLYKIDDGDFQESNVFDDVTGGIHEIIVKGLTGNCNATIIQVNVVKFPQFFTPNSDGFNDQWNISSLADYPEARIVIFDRLGKLIKTILPNGNGWDGTYNGRQMPSTEYWFMVTYKEDGNVVEFKNHFTLKR